VNHLQFEKEIQGEKYGKRLLVFKKSRFISKKQAFSHRLLETMTECLDYPLKTIL
jgi:hypothetical protein